MKVVTTHVLFLLILTIGLDISAFVLPTISPQTYTTKALFQTRTPGNRPTPLHVNNDAKIIRSIKDCKTSRDVSLVLNGTNTTISNLAPSVAATAMRVMVKFDKNSISTKQVLPELMERAGQGVLERQKNANAASNKTLYFVQDVLYSLSLLRNNEAMSPLACVCCDILSEDLNTTLKMLHPRRLVEIVESISSLSLNQPHLLDAICDRLARPESSGKLQPPKLCEGLMALSSYPNTSKAFLRRLRKASVRRKISSRHLVMAIQSSEQMADDEDIKKIAYNMITRELFRPINGTSGANLISQLSVKQIVIILRTINSFGFKGIRVVKELENEFERKIDEARESEISMYLCFLKQYGENATPETGIALGKRLLYLCSDGATLEPRSFVTALRYAVKLFGKTDAAVLSPYLETMENLCTPENSFLSRINAFQLSILFESLVLARCTEKKLLLAIVMASIEPRITGSITPSESCRILKSFTTLVTRAPSRTIQGYEEKVFLKLGPNLLSAKTTPHEAAEAMLAYAKTGYIWELGIFDHLSEVVSENAMDLPPRSIAQCMWSCGKIYELEANTQDLNPVEAPPYLQSAAQFSKTLLARNSELNAKDLAQSLWAMGRLGFCDQYAAEIFANQATKVLPQCFACEIANILWGLSKLGFDQKIPITIIARRMLDSDVDSSPKEAACVLYALATMGVREDEIFSHLTSSMMSQMDQISAQAIANTLYAHKTAKRRPPQMLLDAWVTDRLGIVGIQSISTQIELNKTK